VAILTGSCAVAVAVRQAKANNVAAILAKGECVMVNFVFINFS